MKEAAQYLIMLLALLTIQRSATAAEPRSPEPVMARVESQQRIFAGEFAVYAYCAEQYPHICGGNPTTASGEPVTPGVTVAADPAVLPLGTRVYIDGIGERVVQDTGGAIRGHKIDLAVEGHQEAVEFGRKTAKIYILEDKNEIQIDKKHAHIWRVHPVSD